MRLFGGAQAPKPVGPTPQEAIEKLRDAAKNLETRNAYLETKIAKETKEATELKRKGNKSGALLALKRRQLHQNEIRTNYGIMGNLETQVASIEAAATQLIALTAIMHGTQAMQQMNRTADIDKVEDILESIQEQMQLSEEIGNTLSTPMAGGADISDLERELDDLDVGEEEDLDELAALNVPSAKVGAGRAKQPARADDEFGQLQADMDFN